MSTCDSVFPGLYSGHYDVLLFSIIAIRNVELSPEQSYGTNLSKVGTISLY